MLDTPCSEVVWRALATHSIRQFLLHLPSRTSLCAITFQLESTLFHTLLPISAPEGTAYIGDRASTNSSSQCRFLCGRSQIQISAQKYFLLGELFRNSSQMLAADVLQIRPRYLPSTSLPTDHSLCIQSLKRSAVGIAAQRPGFNHGSVQVGFVFTEVTTGLVFTSPSLLLVNILPLMLHSHIIFRLSTNLRYVQ